MNDENRGSGGLGGEPRCPCPFASVCSGERQTVARMLDVAPLECLVYPFLLLEASMGYWLRGFEKKDR